MNLVVLVDPGFEKLAEIERAIEAINRVQTYYRVSIATARWIKDDGRVSTIDYDTVFKEKEKRYARQPVMIVTKTPLKLGWTAYYKTNMYIVTIAGTSNRYQHPPLRILIMYLIATSLGTLECKMTERELDNSPVHEGRPIGCISDLCEKEEDLFISMKKAHICPSCKGVYRKAGLPVRGLSAIERILKSVKEDALKYDKKVPYDVFISYSHKDKSFVDRIADLLETKRFKVWYDDFSILAGDSILNKLAGGIKNSKCFIVVLSPESVKSGWCKHELEMAFNLALGARSKKRVNVLPVLYKKCKIPGYLKPYKYADLQKGNFEKGMLDIWAALQLHSRHNSRAR